MCVCVYIHNILLTPVVLLLTACSAVIGHLSWEVLEIYHQIH